jgi:hypothetical protein
MDRNSFIYEDGSLMKGSYFHCDVNAVDAEADSDLILSQLTESHVQFRNIQIRGAMLYPDNDPNRWEMLDSPQLYLENFFEPPMLSLDGQTLYLWPKTDERGYPLLITRGIQTIFITNRVSAGVDVFELELRNGWTFNIRVDVIINGQARDAAGIPLGRRSVMSYKTYGVSEKDKFNAPSHWSPLSDPSNLILPDIMMAVAIKAENVKPDIDIDLKDFVTDFNTAGINTGSNIIRGAPAPGNWIYIAFTSDPAKAKVSGAVVWEHPYWHPEILDEVTKVILTESGYTIDVSYQLQNFVEDLWYTYPKTEPGAGSLVKVLDTESWEYQAIYKALSRNLNLNYFDMGYGLEPLYVVKYQFHPGMEALFQKNTRYDPPILTKITTLNIVAVTNWDESYLGFINDPSEPFYANHEGNWLTRYIHAANSGGYDVERSQPHKFFNLGSRPDDPRPPNGSATWGDYWFGPLRGQRWMTFEYDY